MAMSEVFNLDFKFGGNAEFLVKMESLLQRIDARFDSLEEDVKESTQATDKMADSVDDLNDSFKEGVGEMSSFGEKLKDIAKYYLSFSAIRAGAERVWSFGMESMDAYSTQERAENQLKGVMRNRGNIDQFQTIKDYAAEIQGRSIYGDEAMIKGAGELATYVKGTESLKSMMDLLTDYAAGMTGGGEVSPEQMESLATGLGMAYDGNYTTFKEKKQLQYEQDLRHYEQMKAEVARQEEIIRRFKEHNTEHLVKRAQSREKRLAMLDMPDKPTFFREKLKIRFDEKLKSGQDVLQAEDLAMSFTGPEGVKHLFSGVNMDIKKGDRICMVGPNGVGKTTLLKIILGELDPDSGWLKLGQNVVCGYYDQEQKLLDPEKTVLEEVHTTYIKYDQVELRKLLGLLGFYGDDIFKYVKDLAGGEKAKLSLLKLMMTGANFLILDEPTNHLDIAAKEVFEDALLDFPGTLLIVSHDRYLLQKIPTAIYELKPEGITVYLGSYDYYEQKSSSVTSGKAYLETLAKGANPADAQKLLSKEERTLLRQKEKEEAAAKRKRERQLQAAEETVSEAENRVTELENRLCLPEIYSDPEKAREVNSELLAAREDLEKAYEDWMELQEEA